MTDFQTTAQGMGGGKSEDPGKAPREDFSVLKFPELKTLLEYSLCEDLRGCVSIKRGEGFLSERSQPFRPWARGGPTMGSPGVGGAGRQADHPPAHGLPPPPVLAAMAL